jgi:hypothetical protein
MILDEFNMMRYTTNNATILCNEMIKILSKEMVTITIGDCVEFLSRLDNIKLYLMSVEIENKEIPK